MTDILTYVQANIHSHDRHTNIRTDQYTHILTYVCTDIDTCIHSHGAAYSFTNLYHIIVTHSEHIL